VIAVREALRLKIPIIGLVDSNCDPDPVSYVVPGNDDAIRSCKLITEAIAGVVQERGSRFRFEEEEAQRERDEAARKEAEERARVEAEEQARKEAEEQARAEAQAAEGQPAPVQPQQPPPPAPEPTEAGRGRRTFDPDEEG